jgi:folate-binding protein YgfZ
MSERTPLHEATARAGAVFVEEAGWLVPAHFGDAAGEYRTTLEAAAMFDLSPRGKVQVTGADAVTFLHNLSTNDIARLPVGAGCEAFLTTAQARIIAHVFVSRLVDGKQEALWLDLTAGLAGKVIGHLDHYLISEQVELADRTRDFAQVHLAGPLALTVLKKALPDDVPELAPLQNMVRSFGEGRTSYVRRHDPLGLPGFDILIPPDQADRVWQALTAAGARPAGRESYEVLRVEAGTPEYGRDLDESNLPQEVGRTPQAVSFTKGCFLGQEPIVRIRDLGHVNRTLLGLKVAGAGQVPPGAKLFRAGQEAGKVTSAVASPRLGTVALAYVRRGSDRPGTAVEVETASGRVPAEVTSLPFAGPGAS